MPSKKRTASPKKQKKLKLSYIQQLKLRIKKNHIIGAVFLIIMLILLIAPIRLPSNKKPLVKNPITINSSLYSSKELINNPVRIIIPKADIDLPVIDAKVVDGYWGLSENTASYGLGSGQPGKKDNTVIFAHAREGLFYNLKDVKLNDTIYVFTKSKWFRYKVNNITSVYPNQVEIIQPTKNETLTLYTCTGFSDEKRLVVRAIPQN